jgi:hypothetical protein
MLRFCPVDFVALRHANFPREPRSALVMNEILRSNSLYECDWFTICHGIAPRLEATPWNEDISNRDRRRHIEGEHHIEEREVQESRGEGRFLQVGS